MDYFYLDNNNNKVKLELSKGVDLSRLSAENKHLNSIFLKIDNGDGILQENELKILEKLLNKADKLIEITANNGILENEELQELAKKLENNEIKLPNERTENSVEVERGYVEIQITKNDILEMQNNPKFQEQQIEKLKANLLKKFPQEIYNIEVSQKGRGYSYNIYAKSGATTSSQILTQSSSLIRSDGIEIELKDHLSKEITNDDVTDNGLNLQSASFGKFTIVDKNGEKHQLTYDLADCIDKDALDCRRVQKKVIDFFAQLSAEEIDKIIKSGVKEISFSADISEDYFDEIRSEIEEQINKNGYYLDNIGEYLAVISPDFALQKREYAKEISVDRNDGSDIKITDTSENQSIMKIITSGGKSFNINIQSSSDDSEKYHQWQLPKLKEIMSQLPANVLEDLGNEIDNIQLMVRWNAGDGVYAGGSNTIAFKTDYDSSAATISFIHELGHAIDNQTGTMFSKSPKYMSKFNEFKSLMTKLNIAGNHATDNAQELFASFYAYLSFHEDDPDLNHILELENMLEPLKNSDNPDAQKCLQLYNELKSETNNFINSARNLPKNQRADNSIREFVLRECKDLIEEMEQYSETEKMAGGSVLLELTHTLSLDDEDFNKNIEYYKKMSKNEDIPFNEVRELYAKFAQRMMELRPKIKH